jgi:predicted nucleic-acid-binding Zn-ribbon protein
MEKEEKEKIIKALEEHGAILPCPRCGNENFTLLDGYFNQTVQHDLKNIFIGGPSIPSIVVGCSRCGYLSQHSIGILGLLPIKETKNERTQKLSWRDKD